MGLSRKEARGLNNYDLRFKVSKEDAINNFARDSPPSADEYYKYKTPDIPTDIETRIPVMAERLEVSKTESVMEATIIKEPVTETKTVEEFRAGIIQHEEAFSFGTVVVP